MAVNLPVDVRALYAAGKRLKTDRERPVRIAVLVEIDAPDGLVETGRELLTPTTATGIVDVAVIEPDLMLRVDSKVDFAIVLAGSGAHLEPTLRDLRQREIPAVVLAIREDAESFARSIGHPTRDVLVGEDSRDLFSGPLADWMMARLEKLRTALGHNFAFVRKAVAKEAVKHCAWQNAAIGVIVVLPGADMPLMTLNQGRMLLNIAAAYGQPLDKERIKELAAVVASGFALRTFAREVVGLVPGFGWAIKGSVAYSGTMAMGMAAIGYFEKGADLSGVVHSLTERAVETAARIGQALPHGAAPAASMGAVSEVAPAPPAPAGYTAAAPEAETPPALTPSDASQPTLIDVPPAQPKFAVLERTDTLGEPAGTAR